MIFDLRQIAKQRPATNSHRVTHLRSGLVRMEIENPSLFKFIGVCSRSTPMVKKLKHTHS